VHLTTFEERSALDDPVVLQLVADGDEQHPASVRVRELATAEAHRDLELVTLVEELRG
jgi:hypothetical protein